MNELISLTQSAINGELQQTVNARELHAFLESKQDFSTWIKKKLERLRLQENKDFCTAPQIYGTANGGSAERLEYFITLDTAKHIAMMENTDSGFEVRDYFIECEKKLREAIKPQPARVIGATEDKIRAIKFVLDCSNISSVAKETALITSVETLTGVYLGYRPQLEQVTYSAKEIGDMLGISANRVGRIANAHGLKTEEYGLYYLNKSQHSDKQVEHFRYFESAIDKFKAILGDE